MKIRTTFVSNSSSSSFLIDVKFLKNHQQNARQNSKGLNNLLKVIQANLKDVNPKVWAKIPDYVFMTYEKADKKDAYSIYSLFEPTLNRLGISAKFFCCICEYCTSTHTSIRNPFEEASLLFLDIWDYHPLYDSINAVIQFPKNLVLKKYN